MEFVVGRYVLQVGAMMASMLLGLNLVEIVRIALLMVWGVQFLFVG